MWEACTKGNEKLDGKDYLRVLEFDVKSESWTGRHWKYVLDGASHAIGDFTMIDGNNNSLMGLIIERDNGEGTADLCCAFRTQSLADRPLNPWPITCTCTCAGFVATVKALHPSGTRPCLAHPRLPPRSCH